MTANASSIFDIEDPDPIRRLNNNIKRLRLKLLAQIRALHILKSQSDETFIDDLLFQMDVLRKAHDRQLYAHSRTTLHDIYVKIIEIRERVRATQRDYDAEAYIEYKRITLEISMVAKWTLNLKQQKLSLARDAQQSTDEHTAD